MKILLIDPPGQNLGLNAGLGYLATLLKDDEVRVLDIHNRAYGKLGGYIHKIEDTETLAEIKKELNDFDPDIIGLSIKTPTSALSKKIVNSIKGKKIIVGGMHITLEGEEFLRDTNTDVAVLGEGESSFVGAVEAFRNNTDLSTVKGIMYRKDSELITTEKADLICNLDELPFPDYSVFDSVIKKGGVIEDYSLLTSRGCPYNCKYCTMFNLMGRGFRARTPENVVAELEQAVEKYQIKKFNMIDDNFSLNIDRAVKICDLIIEKEINLPWYTHNGVRADRLSKDLLLKMHLSGCKMIWLGVESADPKVFKEIDKGENLDDIKQSIMWAHEFGIEVSAFFIIGLPYSTLKSDLMSVEFSKKYGIDGWWFMFVPFPHTQYWDWVKKNAKMLKPHTESDLQNMEVPEPVFETPDYSEKDRLKAYYLIHILTHNFDRLVDKLNIIGLLKLNYHVLRYKPASLGNLYLFLVKIPGRPVYKAIKSCAKYVNKGINKIHNMVLKEFKIQQGNWVIKNTISSKSAKQESILLMRNTPSQYLAELDIKFKSNSSKPPWGGAILYSNYNSEDLQYSIHLTICKQQLEIWTNDERGWRMKNIVNKINLPHNKWLHFQLECTDNSLILRLDGTEVIKDDNFSIINGSFGIGAKYCDASFRKISLNPISL